MRTVGKVGAVRGINGVDREIWVTISRTAVALKVGTAMAAEVAGVCVLTGILDLDIHKCLFRISTNALTQFRKKKVCLAGLA